MLRAVSRLHDPSIPLIRAQDLDLRLPGPVPSPWTLARSFVLSSTDLTEVQINNIQTRARAAQSTLLVVYMSYNWFPL